MSRLSFKALDDQLGRYGDLLREHVKLTEGEAYRVATTVAAEVRFLEPAAKSEIIAASPVHLSDRVNELLAFQKWMEWASAINGRPPITRAQVITQNYICFVYLPEACFRALRQTAATGSITRRCCKYLTDNPVRAFRNAIAHANWTYSADFGGLAYWSRKGQDETQELSRFEVRQEMLDFWQKLSRTVAYAAYLMLQDTGPEREPTAQ